MLQIPDCYGTSTAKSYSVVAKIIITISLEYKPRVSIILARKGIVDASLV